MKTTLRFASLLSVFCLAAACHDHGGTGREPDEYTGCAADEQWRVFDDETKNSVTDPTQAPAVTAPTPMSLRAADGPPVFAWTRAGTDVGMTLGDVPHENGPDCNNCCPQWNGGALGTLHLPPISGTVYDLQFAIDGKVAWRVLTTLQEYKPTITAWDVLSAAPAFDLSVTRMAVLRNDPKEGPFVAPTPTRFTVSR